MARGDERDPVLPYARPARPCPSAPHPPLMTEVGCCSSLVGASLLGVVLPWAGFRYAANVLNDFWPVIMVIGGVAGAVVAPTLVLGAYWIIWRVAGRP